MVEFTFNLGQYQQAFEDALSQLDEHKVLRRIEIHDYTLWSDSPDEITNRLGWLHIMDAMQAQVGRMRALAQQLQEAGYTHVLLLGMGGSSLAPDVFSLVFDDADGLTLKVLDSTDPGAVLGYRETLPLDKTVFIVATKSGGTAETLSFFKYFYNEVLAQYGGDSAAAGQHFIGITDPGSKLETLAATYHFRDVFLNDPNIGGRYSVLSFFGLVPAALIGLNVATLLERAQAAAKDHDHAAKLGAVMGAMHNLGRDKLTLIASPTLVPFGDWAEQLIAESTGKAGKGILPVVGASVTDADGYGDDRVFIYLRLADDTAYDEQVRQLQAAGQPVVTIQWDDRYNLGGQFFIWELATAVAGYLLQIQPFDQPNVEAAKKEARAKIEAYQQTGKLEALPVAFSADGVQIMGDVQADSLSGALKDFLSQAEDGAYVAIHAYIHPTAHSSALLATLQDKVRARTQLATTVGYGPRFLHSTGQLHKGDGGKGLFIQLLAAMPRDVAIPDEAGQTASSMHFGTLKEAQALGDRAALLAADRKVLRLYLDEQAQGLQTLINAL